MLFDKNWMGNHDWQDMCEDEDGNLDFEKFKAGPNEAERDRLEAITDAKIQDHLDNKQ